MESAIAPVKKGIVGRIPGRPNNPDLGLYIPNDDHLTINPANYVKDEETGFLVPSEKCVNGIQNLFNAEKKIKFLELAEEYWPNIHKICKEMKMGYNTFKNHMLMDSKFAHCMEMIKQAKVDHVEGNVFTFSGRPANFMDRMAILRAYRGELYNPVQKVQHVGSELSKDEVFRRRASLATAVDAEVVEASSQVLDAEIVPNKSGVPEVAKVPVQTPSGQPSGTNGSLGGEAITTLRDPLLALTEE